MHVKVHLVATAVAVAVNPIQLAPASTAWLEVAAAVRAAMVGAGGVAGGLGEAAAAVGGGAAAGGSREGHGGGRSSRAS